MKRLCLGCAMLFLALVAVIAYLWFAGPQANRWSYRLYANYFYYTRQSDYRDEFDPPNDFNGVWKEWYGNGMRRECECVNGKRDGKMRIWDENGQLCLETFGRESIFRERRWMDGHEIADGVYRHEVPWYGRFWKHGSYAIVIDGELSCFLNGRQVTAEAYDKWVKETGGIPELLKRHPEIKR